MLKHWLYTVAIVAVFLAAPALAQKVGDTIQFEYRGETVEGVVEKVEEDGERYLVEVKTGPRAGKKQMVHQSKIVGGDPEAPAEVDDGPLEVGSKVRFKDFFDETVIDGVITEVFFDGKLFRVKVTSGDKKGKEETVRREAIVRGDGKPAGKPADKPREQDKPKPAKAGDYDIGMRIKYKGFPEGTIEGVIVEHVGVNGTSFRVQVMHGNKIGKQDQVRLDDILGKVDDGGKGWDIIQARKNAIAALQVGSKVKYKDSKGVQEGVVTEVFIEGRTYRVEPTAGEDKGKWTMVSVDDFLFGGEDEQATPTKGDLSVNDVIQYKEFFGGTGEGVICKVSRLGDSFEVLVKTGKDEGEIVSVKLDDVLQKTGREELTVADIVKGIELTDKTIKVRAPITSTSYKPLPEAEPFWALPAAKAGPALRGQRIDLKVSSASVGFFVRTVGMDALVSGGSPAQLQVVGLDTGQVSETIEGLVPVSTSPGGDRVLMSLSTAFYGDRFKEKQHHLFAMTPERKLQHLAKLELPEEGLDWSMLVSSDLLAIKTKDGLSVHNLSTGERGIATKMMGWHQFDSDRNALFMYGLDRFESPSGDGSMVNGTKILAVDLATGKVLGLRSLPYMVFQFAPSPDGKRLVFRSDPDGNARGGGDIVTLDMTTGKEIGRLSLASKSKGLSWIDDRFVLIQGSGMLVLDTTTHMIVKRIETPRLIAVQGQALVSAVRSKQSSREAAVIVTPLNSQELIAASNKIDPKTALAVGPGSSMALDINTTADRKEVESILTAKLIDAGINVDPNAKTRLSVTTQRKSIQRKYREGVNKEQTVSVEEIRITLELKQDGQTQWSTEKVQSPPFSIMVREGETLNQAVARLSGKEAELRMVDRLPMPTRVMSDQMLEQIEKITIE